VRQRPPLDERPAGAVPLGAVGKKPPRRDAEARAAEARLLEALRSELRWIQEKKVRLLSLLEIDRIGFGDGDPEEIASCSDRGVRLHRSNPLVEEALARWREDPILVGILASAAYTALNHERADVTDADERRFHLLLADFLASGSPAR
jgi:hypothetical protein